jgi:cupin fold WbuC family metalloprotein
MRLITQDLLDYLLAEAAVHPRRRAVHRFHAHEEPVQRMLNAIHPGSYITPHKHENPDKVELIAILRGAAVVTHFSDVGEVLACHRIEVGTPTLGVDIPPRSYHNFVALSPCVILEIIQGPYIAETHKRFASWAPAEGTAETVGYLEQLEARIKLVTQ